MHQVQNLKMYHAQSFMSSLAGNYVLAHFLQNCIWSILPVAILHAAARVCLHSEKILLSDLCWMFFPFITPPSQFKQLTTSKGRAANGAFCLCSVVKRWNHRVLLQKSTEMLPGVDILSLGFLSSPDFKIQQCCCVEKGDKS